MRRFDNPAILHKTTQVASDGSQKLPVRLLATIRERLDMGQSIARLAHVVAAWIRYLGGADDRGARIAVNDPLCEPLQTELAAADHDAEAEVAAVMTFEQIFGAELSSSRVFRRAVLEAYVSITARGVRAATSALADIKQ